MKKIIILLLIILSLAAFLRMYKLDTNPPSLYWDEASLGYNAFAILTTGHDEHGEFLPITRFIAFGDYKPPSYIYAIVPAMAVFGVNEFAIRFPSAASGILLVLVTYILGMKLFRNQRMSLMAALFLAISPWDLQLSRAAFEAHLAVFLSALGILLFIKSLEHRYLLPISIFLFILSFYTFNANRILTPLFIGGLSLLYIKDLINDKKWIVISLILGFILIWPNFSYLRTRESRLRFQEVSIFTSLDTVKKANSRIERDGNTWLTKILHNRRIYFLQDFLKHYVDHFRGDYLFISGDRNPRLSTQTVGELYIFELPLLIIGAYWLVKKRNKSTAIIFGWLLLAPIPAATARETPHMLRTASILPIFQLITAVGTVVLIDWSSRYTNWKKAVTGVLAITLFFNMVYYLHTYWAHYAKKWSGEWQYGYSQMVEKVTALEGNYDRIIVTSNLGRPYIYFLLYNHINPLEYVKIRRAERDWYGFWEVAGFGKYDFTGKNNYDHEKVLRVGTKGTFNNGGKKLDEVIDPAGHVVFEIGEP